MDDELRDLVRRVARGRMKGRHKFDRWMRALDELVPDETPAERVARLTELHWDLFDEAPPFNRDAPRPNRQEALPLTGAGE